MEIVQVVGLALVSTVLILVVKDDRPQMAMLLALTAGALIFLWTLPKLAEVFGVVRDLSSRAGLHTGYLGVLFRVVGVAYLANFGAEICRDAGQGALGTKLEFAGKILILFLSIPLLLAILDTVVGLIP